MIDNDKLKMISIWKQITDAHLKDVSQFLSDLRIIGDNYDKTKRRISDIGFNVFQLTSDIYYRENYHSDVIKAFLDPTEKHCEKSLFLQLFIEMLNRTGKTVSEDDFKDAEVVREEGRIDILIKSETTKRAIIIENKMNNAGDMVRQLPRYYDKVSSNYKIDAIVYLPLDKSKRPDESSWTRQDRINVHQHLVIIPAYSLDNGINLVDSWIKPAILHTHNINCIAILRQYADLITFLNSNIMDTIILEKFYNTLMDDNNIETAKSIRNMMNDLPEYMAIRLENKYKDRHAPFTKIWRYKGTDTVFEGYTVGELYLKMDIWCNETGYYVHFWEPNEKCDVLEYFKTSKTLVGFEYYNNNRHDIVKHFDFNDENGLLAFLDSFLVELSQRETNKNI